MENLSVGPTTILKVIPVLSPVSGSVALTWWDRESHDHELFLPLSLSLSLSLFYPEHSLS